MCRLYFSLILFKDDIVISMIIDSKKKTITFNRVMVNSESCIQLSRVHVYTQNNSDRLCMCAETMTLPKQ